MHSIDSFEKRFKRYLNSMATKNDLMGTHYAFYICCCCCFFSCSLFMCRIVYDLVLRRWNLVNIMLRNIISTKSDTLIGWLQFIYMESMLNYRIHFECGAIWTPVIRSLSAKMNYSIGLHTATIDKRVNYICHKSTFAWVKYRPYGMAQRDTSKRTKPAFTNWHFHIARNELKLKNSAVLICQHSRIEQHFHNLIDPKIVRLIETESGL